MTILAKNRHVREYFISPLNKKCEVRSKNPNSPTRANSHPRTILPVATVGSPNRFHFRIFHIRHSGHTFHSASKPTTHYAVLPAFSLLYPSYHILPGAVINSLTASYTAQHHTILPSQQQTSDRCTFNDASTLCRRRLYPRSLTACFGRV